MPRPKRPEPLTVQGLIDKLQQMVKDGKARHNQYVFVSDGEGTVSNATEIHVGFAYRYTDKETYGGTDMLFVPEKEDDSDEAWVATKKHHGIWIG